MALLADGCVGPMTRNDNYIITQWPQLSLYRVNQLAMVPAWKIAAAD